MVRRAEPRSYVTGMKSAFPWAAAYAAFQVARDLGPLRAARDQGELLQARQVLHQSSRKAASPGYSGLGEASEKLLAV